MALQLGQTILRFLILWSELSPLMWSRIKAIPTDSFLNEKPFWNFDRIGILLAIIISIIALFAG